MDMEREIYPKSNCLALTEIYPKSNCLALTVRKEHRLVCINRAARKTIRVSWKTLLYTLFLTVANIFV